MSVRKPLCLAGFLLMASLTIFGCGDSVTIDAQEVEPSQLSGSPDKPSSATWGSGHSSAPDGASGGGLHRCRTRDLAYEVGGTVSGGQESFAVAMTNKTVSGCTLMGFPGVELLSASDSWSFVTNSEIPKMVTLRPGETTQFHITYRPWREGDGRRIEAARIAVTPPDETTSEVLDWPGCPVSLQDAAAHKGIWVSPIG